jgi:phage terminase small subunit
MASRRNEISIRLTEKQQKFVHEIVKGRIPVDAAREAGFQSGLKEQAFRLMHTPAVAAAIRFEITRLLTVEALPLAYRVLTDLARDSSVPAAVRRACARDLMDRAGFVTPKAPEAAAGAEKPLSEMSSDELRGLVDRLESELGARAVDVTPDSAQHSAQKTANPLSFLD